MRRHGLALTAYSPLGRGAVLDDPVLEDIATTHGKSTGQVALRWLLQQPEVIAIPKAEDAGHASENLDVFDFELSRTEMTRISGLSRPDGRMVDPDFAPAWDEAT